MGGLSHPARELRRQLRTLEVVFLEFFVQRIAIDSQTRGCFSLDVVATEHHLRDQLTLDAMDNISKEPDYKKCAVRVEKV